MKKIVWIALVSLGMIACTTNNDKSDAYGNFESTEVMVSALAQGEILFLDLEEGDVLHKGATVGLIDTLDLWLKRNQMIVSKEAVRTGLITIDAQMDVQLQQRKNLMVDKDRLEKLFKDGAATQKQLDDINGGIDLIDAQLAATKSQKQKIQAEIQSLDASIEQVNEALSKCNIIVPSSGTVLTKYAEAGEVAAMGRPLFKLADMEHMKLKVYVSGDQIPHIKIGQKVEVEIDENKTENRSIEGSIIWVSSSAEFTPKTIQTKDERVNLVYAVKVLVKNDGSLKIGMPGEVNF